MADAPTTSLIITAIGSIISGSLLAVAKVIEAIAKYVEAKNGDDDEDQHHHRRKRHRRDDDESGDDDPPLSLLQCARLAI